MGQEMWKTCTPKTTKFYWEKWKNTNATGETLLVGWEFWYCSDVRVPQIYRFNVGSIKILVDYFVRNWQADSKISLAIKKTYHSQNSFPKEQQSWETKIIWFQDYKALAVKTVWYQHKDRAAEQNLDFRNAQIYICTIFDKSAEGNQWGKDNLQQKALEQLHICTQKQISIYISQHIQKKWTQNGS